MSADEICLLREYAERAGVPYHTAHRWVREGMPVRRGARSIQVHVLAADDWVRRFRNHSIAIRRESRVYIAKSEAGPVKVGFSSDLPRRLAELSLEEYGCVTLAVSFPGDRNVELRIHEELGDLRIDGEWFRDHPRIVSVASKYAAGYYAGRVSAPQRRVLIAASQSEASYRAVGADVGVCRKLVSIGFMRRVGKRFKNTYRITETGSRWIVHSVALTPSDPSPAVARFRRAAHAQLTGGAS